MLARKIYEESFIDPGSCRINPNLLVGTAAADYAWDHNVCVVTESHMVTPGARARFRYWEREWKKYLEENPPDPSKVVHPYIRRPLTPIETRLARLVAAQKGEVQPVNSIANGITNGHGQDPMNTTQFKEGPVDGQLPNVKVKDEGETKDSAKAGNVSQSRNPQPKAASMKPIDGQDGVGDTVGAIAVDMWGNIAAGSSSGGIGLKHPGRVGPAALIGIGTHVIPVDPTDPEEISAAAVTSGTGEQLATTFAAQTCAQRVYFSQKMGNAGTFTEVTEEEALEAAIKKEFSSECRLVLVGQMCTDNGLDHPSAVHNEVSGCIGVMTVKKTIHGIGFYFAHTTETMVSRPGNPSTQEYGLTIYIRLSVP